MNLNYTDIRCLSTSIIQSKIWIQGRVDYIRTTGNNCFITLRYGSITLQLVIFKKKLENTEDFKQYTKIPLESIIDVYGSLQMTNFPITSTSYKNIEMIVDIIKIANKSEPLPFSLVDANDFTIDIERTNASNVSAKNRFDNRWLDLRTPVNNSIFKIKAGVCKFFRNFLDSNNFIEIHTPKILGTNSESGSDVFQLDYFGKNAYLSQSPQLYKQMALNFVVKQNLDVVILIGYMK